MPMRYNGGMISSSNREKMVQIERIEIPVPLEPGSMNCYYISGSTPTLIDTGINTPDALQSLQDGLRKLGAGVSDIRRIILTHGHSDHAGLAGAVAAISKAPVLVHYRDRRRTLSGSEQINRENEVLFRGFFEKAGVPGDIVYKSTAAILGRLTNHFSPLPDVELLEGGEIFSFNFFNLSVLHTPGHTPGSICLFDETNGILISGDSLIRGVIPYVTMDLKNSEDLPRYCALEQYERSLEVMSALPVRTVLPGHGAPFSDHRELIERVKRERAKRRRRILQILGAKRGGQSEPPVISQFEVAKSLFLFGSDGGKLLMAISEVRGCLEMLEKEGLVTAITANDGKWLYHLN